MSDEDDLRAAEYVLGTLGASERGAFERHLGDDPVARRAVIEWETRLAPLGNVVADVAMPTAMWARILSLLPGGERAALQAIGGRNVVILRRARDRWRAAALAVGALAAGLAAFVVDRELLPPAIPDFFVAAINRGGDQPAMIVRVDLGSKMVTVRPIAAEAPAGHSLELWYIGGDKAPKSMGLVNAATRRMPIPDGLSPQKATFAVSVEPPGGSPTGSPTGPVVYSGKLIEE